MNGTAWPTELATQIRATVESGRPAVITVPDETRKALAERALQRMSPGNRLVTFKVEARASEQHGQ